MLRALFFLLLFSYTHAGGLFQPHIPRYPLNVVRQRAQESQGVVESLMGFSDANHIQQASHMLANLVIFFPSVMEQQPNLLEPVAQAMRKYKDKLKVDAAKAPCPLLMDYVNTYRLGIHTKIDRLIDLYTQPSESNVDRFVRECMAMEPTLEVSQGIYQRAAQQKQSTNQDFDFITDKRYCRTPQDRRMIADLVTLGDITVQSLFSKVCLKLIALDQGQQQQAQEKEKYVDDVIGVHLNGRQAIL